MTGAKRIFAAIVFSFAVYLTPLVGPHAAFLLGEVVWREVGGVLHGRGDQGPAWIATDVGVALFAQLAFFGLVHWFLRRPGWRRGLLVGLPVLPAIIALNYAYMVVIPMRFLIAPDTTAERGSWPLECTARHVWMPQIPSPPTVLRATPIWVADVNPPNRYGLLDPSACTVAPLELAQSAMMYVTYVAGGRALYMTTTQTGRQAWFVFDAATGTKLPVAVGEGQSVILSTDGRSVAWLRPVAGTTPPIQLEAAIRKVDGGGESVVDLSALGRGGLLQLVQLDTEAGELIVAQGLSKLFWVGIDGHIRKTLPKPEEVKPQPQTFRLLSDGWVAWDAYRDNEPYRIAWSLPGGKGSHQVPKGRSITSLAVSPDGRWIALSVTSSLSIGSTPDAVSVLRVADGSEVFRRYFPKYTRSSLAFPDSDRFAYTDLEGTHILKIVAGDGRPPSTTTGHSSTR